MGILKKIESLREQPKSVRNQYAFWIALSVSLIITLVWVATIPSRFLPAEVATSSQHDGISNFAQNIKDISYQLGESISAIRTKAEYAQTEFVATSSVNTLYTSNRYKTNYNELRKWCNSK